MSPSAPSDPIALRVPSTPFPDEDLPEGSVVDGESLTSDRDESFDYVVIGSGAGGAVAAHTLASAGYKVAIVEEGPWVKTRDFGEDVLTAFRSMMRDAGTQVMSGRSHIPLVQGRCVGGSTVVNSAIAWRLPEDVIDDWALRFGLDDITMAALEPHFDALEEALNVRTAALDVLGRNNELFMENASRMGATPTLMRRYDKGCKGSGRCLTGCPSAAKQGMSVSYVPWALAKGARIFTSCRADKVDIQNGRAVGVIAHTSHREFVGGSKPVTVRLRAARGVFVAASTVQTPNILHRSGIRSAILGRHFQAHPGVGVGGLFDEPINQHFGVTQAVETIDFRKTHRFKPETISMQPELAAVRIPGVGRELVERMGQYAHLAVWAVQVRARAEGTVRPGFGGSDKVQFTMGEQDMKAARLAVAMLTRMMFESGAREVWPGIYGVPYVMKSIDQVKAIDDAPLDPRCYSFVATHLFGAARMSRDERASVVGPDFATHAAERLFVVDSSVFPTNLGVNPQHSIMALSRLAATRVAERALSAVAA